MSPEHDWLDYLGALSGLAGALLAGIAILYAATQSTKIKREAIDERRIEFELGLLAQIRYQMSITQFQHLSGYIGALVINPLVEAELPLLRAVTGTKAGPIGRAKRDMLAEQAAGAQTDARTSWLTVAEAEVDEAITTRLKG